MIRSLLLARRSRSGAWAWATVALGFALEACETGPSAHFPDEPPSRPAVAAPPSPADGPHPFVEVAAETGLDFVHRSGRIGEHYFHEMMGSGVALLDYDGDGALDVYLVQGHSLGEPDAEPPMDRLFRNDLEVPAGGERRLRFTDVTTSSGILSRGYGMGAVAADFDGDGWSDLYVTNFGANQLWRNAGDGTFEDATERAGVAGDRWSVPAVAFDFDRDGDLDLFVGNYVDFRVATHQRCTTDLGEPNYCGPLAYRPEPDALYRNRGDGTFEEVTGVMGLSGDYGGALGAGVGDFDGDGWLDLYVANDGVPNQLWRNERGQRFSNQALLAGCAVGAAGEPQASMGVSIADVDGDGDEDVLLTHLTRETNALYLNEGDGLFLDQAAALGLGLPSWDFTGFGAALFDYDNDGRLDALTVNGAVKIIEALARAGDPFPLHQPNQLFWRQPDGTFAEVTARPGPAFAVSEVSRGAAFGDLDNDGDTDVVVSNNDGPVRLLRNQAGDQRPWLGVRLVTGDPPRDALGAWAALEADGEAIAWRRVAPHASYASSNDPRLLFGLGERDPQSRFALVVQWPDGSRERLAPLVVGEYATLRQGDGEAVPVVSP